MKMSQLKMVIREVVREEIRMGLKEVLGGVKKQPVQKPKPKQKQNYTKNPVLNEVLNDTSAEDWETMGGTTYTSERMDELVGDNYKDLMNGQPQQPNVDQRVAEMGANPNSVPKEVKDNIFNKDYRELMKAVDKKKQQKNGG